MRGIDWDKVRRNRNVWKPDYRENFRRPPSPPPCSSSASKPPELPLVKRSFFPQLRRASEIKAWLKQRGLRGNKLKKLVRAVLKDEQQLAWIAFDLDCEEMRNSGFEPCMPEIQGNIVLVRFQLRSAAGEVVEERVYSFRDGREVRAEQAAAEAMRPLNAGINPDVVAKCVTVAGFYIEGGVRSFAEFSQKMTALLGDRVKPALAEIWRQATSLEVFKGIEFDHTGMEAVPAAPSPAPSPAVAAKAEGAGAELEAEVQRRIAGLKAVGIEVGDAGRAKIREAAAQYLKSKAERARVENPNPESAPPCQGLVRDSVFGVPSNFPSR